MIDRQASTGARDGPQILIVEDDGPTRQVLARELTSAGYRVAEADTGASALERFAARRPDLVLLDLGLPDIDGLQVIRAIRREARTPIVILSGRYEEREKVEALDRGADDYVTKPFGPRELVARLRAAMRRAPQGSEDPVVDLNGLQIDVAAHRVSRDGEEIHLTPTEFELLRTLVRNRGRLMTHRALLTEVWGPAWASDTATLRTHVANLRRKIEPPDGEQLIRTDPGIGYRIAV